MLEKLCRNLMRKGVVEKEKKKTSSLPAAEIFFGITFFGSLVTAPVMMQYRKPVQQEID